MASAKESISDDKDTSSLKEDNSGHVQQLSKKQRKKLAKRQHWETVKLEKRYDGIESSNDESYHMIRAYIWSK